MVDNFAQFADAVHRQFEKMKKHPLYVVDIPAETMWEAYLAAFPEGTNPMMATRTEHDCQTCRSVVHFAGNVVSFDGTRLRSIWEIEAPYPYNEVAAAMVGLLQQHDVRAPYYPHTQYLGVRQTLLPTRHYHLYLKEIPATSRVGRTRGEALQALETMQRLLDHEGAIREALEVAPGLYRGAEHVVALNKALASIDRIKTESMRLPRRAKCLALYNNSGPAETHFLGSALGSFVKALKVGTDMDSAVRQFEAMIAPQNYRRTQQVVSPKMAEAAIETIRSLGYEGSLARRMAQLSDISVSAVLFTGAAAKPRMKDPLADLLAPTKRTKKRASSAGGREVDIDTFVSEILPGSESVKIRVEREHYGNFVALTAPAEEGTKPLFRWGNSFAWSYVGEATDAITERVKEAGGAVDGWMRASLSWRNTDDLDLAMLNPNPAGRGEHVYFGHKSGRYCTLDVDMNVRDPVRNAVENIVFPQRPPPGKYSFIVTNFNQREHVDVGFSLLLVVGGRRMLLEHPEGMKTRDDVTVATVTVMANGREEIQVSEQMKESPATAPSFTRWGITSGEDVEVDIVATSPNYWGADEADGRGALHYIFALRGCEPDQEVRSIYNEYLNAELLQHRKAMDLLGTRTKCQPGPGVAGLGFTANRGQHVLITVTKNNKPETYLVSF